MNRTYRKFLVTGALTLTACSTPYQRPEAPIPPAWAVDAQPSASDVAKVGWRSFFADPRLQAWIELALKNNRDLRIAAARVEEARAQYGIARADRLPTANALVEGSRDHTPTDLTTGASSQRYDAQLSVASYELDFWGRVANLSSAARASFLASEEARREVHLSLVADVANSYFALLEQDELVALAQSSVRLREQSLDLIAKGRDLGGTYDLDWEQANGLLESAKAALAAQEHQRTLSLNALNFLAGCVPDHLPDGHSLEGENLDTRMAPGVPAQVLLQRPDVLAAEQRLLAAHANVNAARAAFFPKISLTAALGLASPTLASLFDAGGGGAWSYQPVISAPLFDGGRMQAGLDVAKARNVIAVADYEKTVQQAFREVADQLSARSALAIQLRSALAYQHAQEQSLKIAQARYDAGMTSYLEVLEAQRQLVAAQQNTAEVRLAALEAATLLYKALGGGAEG